jgi:hypothetical protein
VGDKRGFVLQVFFFDCDKAVSFIGTVIWGRIDGPVP